MLHKQTFEFLIWLEEFNDKKFFDLYKPLYLEIKKRFEDFLIFIIKEWSKFDDNIWWLNPKDCIFRIYKDMRFPRNREKPYKTNLWASISIWWKGIGTAWYYIHIENNKSFFSGWIYKPSYPNTKIIREKIYKNWHVLDKILKNKTFKKEFWAVFSSQKELKKIQKGLDTKHPSIKYIKYKDWLITKEIDNKDVLSETFWNQILQYMKIAKKFNDFLIN